MIGKTISHYRIIEQVGQGGMGEVYLAEDSKLKRNVALKFLPQHLTADKEAKERFEREAQAAAALIHPNIVTIYEIGEHEGQTYIAMEFVEGKTLREIINTPLSPPLIRGETEGSSLAINQAIDITIQLCEGLAKAHEAGIVHRDIKPENILVDNDGRVKILDFGLAKLKGSGNITKETSTLGTVNYMSPEQAKGEEIDHRTDIWSLGVVLYEMLTGELPFKGEYESAVIYAVLNEEPIISNKINTEIKKIISKCLLKKVEERYQSIEELIAELQVYKNDYGKVSNVIVKTSRNRLKKNILPAVLIFILIIIISVYFIIYRPETFGNHNISESEWNNSIAVLPFVDLSPNHDQEYFCDGMAEEIINALTNVGKLRVIARTSAFAFKGKNTDVRNIGKQLDVETLLEGSVRKAGNRLRVTAQLVRTSDGAHLWSKQYDRSLIDVFAIQEEIALAIVNQLKIKLLENESKRVTRHFTENVEAYHQYLYGRHILNRRKAKDIDKAISHFENALEQDSLYLMGYIGLADAYALLPSYANAPFDIAYTKSKNAIYKALEINNQVGEVYASLGWIRILADWDWNGAEQAFQIGMNLNPGYATLNHWYGYLYMLHRKFDKALIKVKRAVELDPLSPVINRVVGEVYFNSGKYEQAVPALKKCLEFEPCFPFAHLLLSGCYSRKSLFSKAFKEIKKLKDCREASYTGADYVEGMIYARMGELEKARQVFRKLKQIRVKSTGFARLCFVLGEKELGYKILEDMLDEHNTWIIFINCSPDFDQVRHEERFQNIIKKIGF